MSVDAAAASPRTESLVITSSLAPTERESTLVTAAPSAEVCAACGLARSSNVVVCTATAVLGAAAPLPVEAVPPAVRGLPLPLPASGASLDSSSVPSEATAASLAVAASTAAAAATAAGEAGLPPVARCSALQSWLELAWR